MQYRVIGVHPTDLTVARGVGMCPQYMYVRVYRREERSLLYFIHEAAEEKAHGANGMDLTSNGGKELK